jgi:hypothetical protein
LDDLKQDIIVIDVFYKDIKQHIPRFVEMLISSHERIDFKVIHRHILEQEIVILPIMPYKSPESEKEDEI